MAYPKAIAMNSYSKTIAMEIAERVASGQTIKEIGKLSTYPTARVIRIWIAESPEFNRIIWDARREAAQQMADELVSIADDTSIDPASRKIMIDTRRWLASRLLKPYNDRLTVIGDEDNPLTMLLAAVDGKTQGPPGKRRHPEPIVEAEQVE